jgi:preprotein translocase subunit SecF
VLLNDTVVIYDRIREMLRRYKRMSTPGCSTSRSPDAVALDHHPRR